MNFLLKPLFLTTLLCLTNNASSSDQITPVSSNTFASKSGAHLVLNAGLTYGGDTIYTVFYTNGDMAKIKGGGLYQVGVGGLYQFENQPFAIKLGTHFHYDLISGSNGGVYFYRFPIETLAYYTGIEKFRIGSGVRVVNSPEISITINSMKDTVTFENTTGMVAELGYQVAPRAWLNGRMVFEKYQGKSFTTGGVATSLAGTAAKSGSHIGVNFSYEL